VVRPAAGRGAATPRHGAADLGGNLAAGERAARPAATRAREIDDGLIAKAQAAE
jgi:hypothetical protein